MAKIQDTSPEDIEHFTHSLVNDTVSKILGKEFRHGDRTPPGFTPRTKFFSGVLSPEEEDPKIEKEIQERQSPASMGLIGRVTDTGDGETVSFTVNLSFALYYRVIPTDEEKKAADNTDPTVYRKCEIGKPVDDDFDGAYERAQINSTVTVSAVSTESASLESVSDEVEDEINTKISDVVSNTILTDPQLYGDLPQAIEGDVSDLVNADQEDLSDMLGNSPVGGDPEFAPDPDLSVEVKLLEGLDDTAASVARPDSALIRVNITNQSDEEPDFEDVDHAFYETQLELIGENGTEFESVTFEDVPSGFRYDSSVPGQGHNCTAVWLEDRKGIRSETVPIHEQHYFKHRDFPSDANPGFENLASDPLPVLRAIRSELKRYKDEEWQQRLKEEREAADNPETDNTVAQVKAGISEFESEIERFDNGISVLENNTEALELFKQTNTVFLRKVREGDPWDESADLEYPGWRPFQIVFIVSLLPDILSEAHDLDVPDHREDVDLLYFPTGGGKTEAYLALLVFTALFDRRRGKDFGLSAMMRFPLRLLTLQQFQRIVEILTHADEVRKEENYGGEPFSAGFFTGNTGNQLKDLLTTEFDNWYPGYPKDLDTLSKNREKVDEFAERWNQVNGKDLDHVNRGEYRAVEQCPICGSDVELIFNTDTDRVEHHCTADEETCDRGKLNVHVTDVDIYRGVPTIVVGTQDKLAAMGYNFKFRTLAGYTTHKCPKHGYTFGEEDCLMTRYCEHDDQATRPEDGGLEAVSPVDTTPTLTLQDELHLVNEDLGTFESHYYSAYEKHLEWSAEKQGLEFTEPKKIAATATIEESKNQVKHLYSGKERIRFPKPGPEYRESAYTTVNEDRTQRFYIGVTPWNRSQINSIIRLLEMHQRRMQDLLDDPAESMKQFDFDELDDVDEFVKLVEHYYTLVTYVISKFEGGRVYKSAETQVNENLTPDGYDPVDRFDMQGNTDPDKMADMLKRFEQLGEEGGTTHEDLDGLVTATSSISHGVDLDALGYMVFFNAPPRMAEYIQASSRVGRRHPGIVLDVFDPIGERDRSHYHYFNKYHEYLDRLVEPVAINRWAKFSVDRTLPGLFMSLLYLKYFDDLVDALGWFSNKEHPRQMRKALQKDVFTQDDIIQDFIEIYGADWETGKCPFNDQIERWVEQSFNRFKSGEEEQVSESLVGRVMLSLRDVDKPIDIIPAKKHRSAFQALGVSSQ